MTAKKEQPKEIDTMHIWDAVCKTDPKFAKQFNKGGYKGTASNPTYLMRKATALWGAAGCGWGYNIIDEKYVDGAPIVIDKAAVCREVIHVVLLEFWYRCDGEIAKTPPQFGQTTFVGKNKNGVFTDEEAPKKSVTDAMVKCMSMLGFSADIFMGMYDDVKYLNSLKDEAGEKFTKDNVAKIVDEVTEPSPDDKLCQAFDMNLFNADINAIGSMDSFEIVKKKYTPVWNAMKRTKDARFHTITDAIANAKAALEPPVDVPPAAMQTPVINDEIRD